MDAKAKPTHLFEVLPCGDPYSKAYDCREYRASFDEDTCTFRGDISGMWGKTKLVQYLRRNYPGCKIKSS
jgi:hypothetical protein